MKTDEIITSENKFNPAYDELSVNAPKYAAVYQNMRKWTTQKSKKTCVGNRI